MKERKFGMIKREMEEEKNKERKREKNEQLERLKKKGSYNK